MFNHLYPTHLPRTKDQEQAVEQVQTVRVGVAGDDAFVAIWHGPPDRPPQHLSEDEVPEPALRHAGERYEYGCGHQLGLRRLHAQRRARE